MSELLHCLQSSSNVRSCLSASSTDCIQLSHPQSSLLDTDHSAFWGCPAYIIVSTVYNQNSKAIVVHTLYAFGRYCHSGMWEVNKTKQTKTKHWQPRELSVKVHLANTSFELCLIFEKLKILVFMLSKCLFLPCKKNFFFLLVSCLTITVNVQQNILLFWLYRLSVCSFYVAIGFSFFRQVL